jgi:mannitol-specific phosphotransferase system IIBC component
MLKFLFSTLWNIFVSAVVCLVIIKFLLHSVVQKEFDDFKENLGTRTEKKYKEIKKKHLSKDSIKNLKKKLFD